MATYLPFAVAGIGALCCLLFGWGLHLVTAEQQVVGGVVKTAKKKNDDSTFILYRITELVGRPFQGLVLSILGSGGRARIRRRIQRANRSGTMTVERYARRKGGDVIFYGALSVITLSINPFISIIVLGYGLAITDLQLLVDGQRRQEKIQQTLPDFLDVLSVTVSAGLGFRHALTRVSDAMPGPLAEEFQVTLQQMELGASRREAFEELRARNASEALGQFITAILQAEELGAPLAQALNDISADMRREYAQWTRRKAQKVNPRITMVTLATILPAIMILVIGTMFFGSNVDFSVLLGS